MRPTDDLDNASGDHYVIDNATSNHNLDDTHPNYHPNPHLNPHECLGERHCGRGASPGHVRGCCPEDG
jgi:hypothetical protein